MSISIIVAMAENGVIGIENRLPWHLPGDMRWFRRHTLGKTVIMGRKTFESIGKPLPERRNIVITRDAAWRADGAERASSPEQAIDAAGAQEVMVLGGANIYQQLLPRADRLYLTLVGAAVEGDAFFPTIDWAEWREVEREDHPADEKNPWPYSFLILDRL